MSLTKEDLSAIKGLFQESIINLEDKISKLENKISKLENRISKLENRMDGLDNRMSGLENELKEFRVENSAEHREIRFLINRGIESDGSLRKRVGKIEIHLGLDSNNL